MNYNNTVQCASWEEFISEIKNRRALKHSLDFQDFPMRLSFGFEDEELGELVMASIRAISPIMASMSGKEKNIFTSQIEDFSTGENILHILYPELCED